MDWVLLVIGGFGFLGMMGLGSILAPVFMALGRNTGMPLGHAPTVQEVSRIEILVPVHNEEWHLSQTLSSIGDAVRVLQAGHPGVQVLIRVGLDACTDASSQIANAHGCEVQSYHFKSKWRVLIALVAQSRGDWVLWVDAGVYWPRQFLANAWALLGRSNVVGVAPAYWVARPGRLTEWIWAVERRMKRWESLDLGGPVSVHGATVFYRLSALREVIRHLDQVGEGEGTSWVVEDVVIPLVMRTLYPGHQILYWEGSESGDRLVDQGVQGSAHALERRKRIVLGNLQWVRWILPWVFRTNFWVGVLALRRVFRLLWGYWILAVLVALLYRGLGILGTTLVGAGVLVLVMLDWVPRTVQKGAFLTSLRTPFYYLSGQDLDPIQWS